MALFWHLDRSVLCHGCCHTGTELSCDTLKLSECVKKTFCEVLKVLDWAKRTAGSRDMRFCVKTVPIQYPLRKGLRNICWWSWLETYSSTASASSTSTSSTSTSTTASASSPHCSLIYLEDILRGLRWWRAWGWGNIRNAPTVALCCRRIIIGSCCESCGPHLLPSPVGAALSLLKSFYWKSKSTA